MKILAKQRLTAFEMSFEDYLQELLEEYDISDVGEILAEKIQKRKIPSREYIAYFSKYLDEFAKACIANLGCVSGNLDYDMFGIDESGRDVSDIISIFIDTCTNIGTSKLSKLSKDYAKLVYTKYKDYIYPVLDDYYYDQVYKEFSDLSSDMLEEFDQNRAALKEYLLSKGFGQKAVYD